METDFHKLIGEVAGVIALAAFVPYIWSILKHRTRPNRASWVIWAVLGVLLLASYHSSGATTTIWIPVTYAIMPTVVFILSLKYGVGGYNYLDAVCLTGAALGLLLWKITNTPEVALYLNIFVDALGFLPTFKKAYLQPASESRPAWVIGASATTINLLAINSWQWSIALYPIYLAVFNSAVAVMLLGLNRERLKVG